ncbi:conserved hypothetical protein [Methylobacterium sp. 4-46]|uniref:DUF6101 family protein n=1 Tax=unclassified Methylobacterium TaxID=2615210 RepID=UPI000152DADB|nr:MULTISPECIES: DUF6101 family protein [Methylobacterium]ACA16707.1 conserved hypothetical protein [Methylobacterium sp. 4-46]WFT82407.1 DUF6101 family protein [Methylobacterium nodulans]
MATRSNRTNRQATPRRPFGPLPTIHRGPVQAEPSPLPIVGRMPGAGRAASVALCLDAEASDAAGEDRFAVMLLDRDGDPLMQLGLYGDADVVAVWRRLGAETGLPLLVIQEDGAVTAMGAQIGRVKLGAVRIRRRHGLLNHRRPRFLCRRKTGKLPLRPAVYREEAPLTDRSV